MEGPTKDEVIAGLPHHIADLQRMQRDLTAMAVESYDGTLLDMAGFMAHMLEHLDDVRDCLGLPEAELTVPDITGDTDAG